MLQPDDTWTLAGPLAVVSLVHSDILVQEMIRNIIDGCKEPMSIPVTESVLRGRVPLSETARSKATKVSAKSMARFSCEFLILI